MSLARSRSPERGLVRFVLPCLACGLLCSSCANAELEGEAPAPPSSSRPDASPRGPEVRWDEGLSLDVSIALALAQSPRLQVARADLPIARAQRIVAGQWPYNPTFSASIERATPFGQHEGGYRVGVSQRFQLGGQRGLQSEAAAAEEARTEATLADAARRLRADVAEAFAQALFARDREVLGEQNLALAGELLAAAEARLQAKHIPEIELNLVRLERERAALELERIRTSGESARARLLALVGAPAGKAVRLVGELVLAPGPSALAREAALALALERRADLLALREAKRAASAVVALERARVWPDLELGLDYRLDYERIEPLRDRDHLLGLELRLPLPILNRRGGEIASARARLARLEVELRAATREVELELDLALQRRALAVRALAVFRERLLDLSRRNLEQTQRAYRSGETNTLAVLRAREDFQRVAAGRLEALLEHRRAEIALEAALGGPSR